MCMHACVCAKNAHTETWQFVRHGGPRSPSGAPGPPLAAGDESEKVGFFFVPASQRRVFSRVPSLYCKRSNQTLVELLQKVQALRPALSLSPCQINMKSRHQLGPPKALVKSIQRVGTSCKVEQGGGGALGIRSTGTARPCYNTACLHAQHDAEQRRMMLKMAEKTGWLWPAVPTERVV